MRAAIIVNAKAGAVRRNPELPARLDSVAGSRAELHLTTCDGGLTHAAEDLARRGVGHVAIVGGDGTASATLTALFHAYGPERLPRIALLRGGTMNTIALSLGVSRRSVSELLRRALEAWENDDRAVYTERQTLRVENRLGFLFGTGVMYGWLQEYYDRGQGHPTPLTAAHVFGTSVLSALVEGPTYRRIRGNQELAVRFEGGAWETRNYITVGAGTVAQAGLGFRPFYRSERDQGRFHLLAIKGAATDLALDLPSIWLGRGMRPRTAYETATSWAELTSPQPSIGYFVDGDLLTAPSRLRLELGPHFRILCI